MLTLPRNHRARARVRRPEHEPLRVRKRAGCSTNTARERPKSHRHSSGGNDLRLPAK